MVNQFKDLWKNLGANQKISLILASGLVALAMIGLMVWASRPDMQLLYGGLNPEETGKMIDAIEKTNTAYEIGSNSDGRDVSQDRRSEGRSLWQLFAF